MPPEKDPAQTPNIPYQAASSQVLHLDSSEMLWLLFDTLNKLEESILISDREGTICYVNAAYIQTYRDNFIQAGISPDRIAGLRLQDLEQTEGTALMQKVVSSSVPQYAFYTDSSAERPVIADLIPLCLNGKTVGLVTFMRNISHIAQMNRQLNHYKKLVESLQTELASKEHLAPPFSTVIGSAPALLQMLHLADRAAPTSSAVCITGESGTGKEVIAEAIHFSSKYADGPLIKVNCAAIPESLMESELFGYERGAFTGANPHGSPGKFELANGGTLFLDEIGDMPLSMQAKLLRVLQAKEVTRLGGTRPIQLKFRLITATNRDLAEMMYERTFREDLYYRINVISLEIPPLRERRQDIPRLAQTFLNEIDESGGGRRFSDAVLAAFAGYDWPGNIRELKNCVERMTVLCPDEIIDTEYLPINLASPAGSSDAQAPLDRSDEDLHSFDLHTALEQVERDTIRAVLEHTGGNRNKAIQLLGISRQNFYIKLEKYGLK